MLQLSEVVIEDPNGVRMMQWLDQKVTQYQGLLGKNLIVPEKVLTKFIWEVYFKELNSQHSIYQKEK